MQNKFLIYLPFNAAPLRVLSWLTDDSFQQLNYWTTAVWRNDGEGPLCIIDTTFSSAAKQQSLWSNTSHLKLCYKVFYDSQLFN